MAPRSAYRALFGVGVGAFAVSFASGLGFEVVSGRRLPPVQGETAFARSVEENARFASIQPRNPYAYVIWSEALEQQGDLAGAIEVLERGVALRPAIGPIHAGLADLYYRKGRFDEAREQARLAVRKGAAPHDRLLRQLGLERVR